MGRGRGQGGSIQIGPTSEAAGPEANIRLLLACLCSLARGLGSKARRAQILGRAQDLGSCSCDC